MKHLTRGGSPFLNRPQWLINHVTSSANAIPTWGEITRLLARPLVLLYLDDTKGYLTDRNINVFRNYIKIEGYSDHGGLLALMNSKINKLDFYVSCGYGSKTWEFGYWRSDGNIFYDVYFRVTLNSTGGYEYAYTKISNS